MIERSFAVLFFHAAQPVTAALIARSASALPIFGTLPIISCVAGL